MIRKFIIMLTVGFMVISATPTMASPNDIDSTDSIQMLEVEPTLEDEQEILNVIEESPPIDEIVEPIETPTEIEPVIDEAILDDTSTILEDPVLDEAETESEEIVSAPISEDKVAPSEEITEDSPIDSIDTIDNLALASAPALLALAKVNEPVAPSEYQVTVRVKSNRISVNGITVELNNNLSAKTDRNGQATFQLPSGSYNASVTYLYNNSTYTGLVEFTVDNASKSVDLNLVNQGYTIKNAEQRYNSVSYFDHVDIRSEGYLITETGQRKNVIISNHKLW